MRKLVFRFRRFVGYKKKIKETLHAHTHTQEHSLNKQSVKIITKHNKFLLQQKNHTLRFGCSQLCL